MKCFGCGATMPFMEESPNVIDCVYCNNKQYPDGVDLLSQSALGFVNEVRPGQITLAETIADNLRDGEAGMYEAGTGVGKSFAYLLPAILSGKRTIISTAKKSLQAQLFDKDLPHVQKHLKRLWHPRGSFKFFFGYGKSNYACTLRIKREKEGTKEWAKYKKFLSKSDYGRWEDSRKLRLKLDESLNAADCVGITCVHHRVDCGYIRARKEMLEADVVVTNNWLLGYHYRLRRELPQFHLLGEFENIIVDEAHKIEDGIRSAFTYETNLEFTAKLRKQFENLKGLAEKTIELPALDTLDPLWLDVFKSLKGLHEAHKYTLPPDVTDQVGCVDSVLVNLESTLTDADFLSKVFEAYTPAVKARLELPLARDTEDTLVVRASGSVSLSLNDQQSYDAVDTLLTSIKNVRETLSMVVESPPNRAWLIEKRGFGTKINYYLKSLPINIGSYLPSTKITYLSATLAINGDFRDFAGRVGLHSQPHGSGVFPSPFDIKKQAFLFIPKASEMPGPETQKEDKKLLFREALGEHIYQLTYANKGNAFVLFSSNDELLSVRQYLTSKMFPYPVISQSEFSPEDAMAQYRNTPNATLLGSKSFWEGVDVSGEKLSLVIICKLPFPNPYDPIVMARQKLVKEKGHDPFPFVDLPDMLLDLRQGVGRLIRTTTDRGVIAILDSRIYTKPYGKAVTDAVGTNPHNNLEKICNWMASRAG